MSHTRAILSCHSGWLAKGVLATLLGHVLAQPEALVVVLNALCKHIVGHAAHETHVAVAVSQCLRHLCAHQMLGPFGSNEPLRETQVRRAAHGHLAVAPRLTGHPLHEVGAVLALLCAQHGAVALRTADAARIGIDNGIAVGAPEVGVWSLKLLQATHALLIESQQPEEVLKAVGIARILAVGAPGDDGGQRLVGVGWQIHIRQNLHPVAQRHLQVLLEYDVVLQRVEYLINYHTFLQQVFASLPVIELSFILTHVAILQRLLANHHFFYVCHNF